MRQIDARVRSGRGAALAAVVGALLAGCEGPFTLSTVFLRPTKEMVGTPADQGYAYEERFVPVTAARRVAIWHVKAANPRGVVVVIPGSDRNKSRYLIGLPIFVPRGYDVILMDYEGFGASTGGPLRLERLMDDGYAVVAYARTLHERVIVFGISTGAATAVRVAVDFDLAGLILEAPLVLHDEVTAWLRAKRMNSPGLAAGINLWVRPQIPASYDILKYMKLVDEPKLILHSTEDDVVPFECGQSVYRVAPAPKTFVKLRARHGRMVEREPDVYSTTIARWLASLEHEDDLTTAPQSRRPGSSAPAAVPDLHGVATGPGAGRFAVHVLPGE